VRLQMRSAAAAIGLASLVSACGHSEFPPVGSPPLYHLTANITTFYRPQDGVTILGTYRPESATLVTWTTSRGSTCFGDVAPDAPDGEYACSTSWPGPSDHAAFPYRPVFWALPSHIIGFGLVTGPVAQVAITMNGVTIYSRAIPLKGQPGLEGYAFPLPAGPADSTRISVVVGRNQSGAVVTQLH
jgi:hypothetical protein